jgi:hypothetical protein
MEKYRDLLHFLGFEMARLVVFRKLWNEEMGWKD